MKLDLLKLEVNGRINLGVLIVSTFFLNFYFMCILVKKKRLVYFL